MSKKIPGTARMQYSDNPTNALTWTYGFDENYVWANSIGFNVKIDWKYVYLWREKNDWLVLQSYSAPPFYFSISELKSAGIDEETIKKADLYGREYNK